MAKTAQELGIKETNLQDNGWYDGYNYDAATGTFGDVRGQIWSSSNPAKKGSMVSEEVNRQSAAAQGKSFEEFDTYLKGSNSTLARNAARNAGTTGSGSGSGSGSVTGSGSSSLNVQKEYDKIYGELGIDQMRSDIAAKDAEIAAKRQQLAEREAQINENPWLSESSRTGRIRKLTELANDEINNLTNEKATLQNALAEKQAELNNRLNIQYKQYDIDRQSRQDAISELNALLTSKADLSGLNIGEYAAKTGMSSATLEALVQASQVAELKPTVVESTDDSGNVTVTIIDANSGSIIGQQSLGRVGKADNSSSKASESDIKRYYLDTLRSDVESGIGVKDIFRLYSGYVDPNQIIQIYNANSPHGPAKESRKELEALGVKY